ncbi:DUF7507 domain-containing protein [Glutamicibacter soli]
MDSVPAGGQRTLTLPVAVSPLANGKHRIQLEFTAADGTMSQSLIDASIAGKEVTCLSIEGERADAGRDLDSNPYTAGEKLAYTFTVKNTGNINQWVVQTEGNFAPFAAKPVGEPSDAGNCRYSSLAAGASYRCTTPRHTVTAEELADGFFTPLSTWPAGRLSDYRTVVNDYQVNGGEVDLLTRRLALSVRSAAPVFHDLDGDGYASLGDTVGYEVTAATLTTSG